MGSKAEIIKEFAVKQLSDKFGYCAVAENSELIILTASNDNEEIEVKIKIKCN